MSNETNLISKPKKLWNDAVRTIKGENTLQLMEDFTAEMTLVAEGLCEDQNKLRGEVDHLLKEENQRIQKLDSRIMVMETAMEEQQRETDRIVTELRSRLAALEKAQARDAQPRKEKKERNRIRDITFLIMTAAAAVIAVTLVLKLVL